MQAKVFTIVLKNEKGQSKVYKNFNASENTEQTIASALYEGYVKLQGKGSVAITKYYDTSDAYWLVESDKVVCEISKYLPNRVKGINEDGIVQLFNAFKNGTQTPSHIVEAYNFLREHRRVDITNTLDIQENFKYDFRVFDSFISNVINNPQKYDKTRVWRLCTIVYGNNTGLYDTNIVEDMVQYPHWLQPKGFRSNRLDTTVWEMSAEIDGKIVETTVKYDLKGIQKYGAVGTIELAGKLVESYVLYVLLDAYKEYTENNIDYKISQVVNQLNRYIEHVRGVDYRENYKSDGKMKEPYEFIVDMQVLLTMFSDKRINKNDVYAVINYFKHNPDKFKQAYEKSNKYMEGFYPWFDGRVKQGQKLFKNVSK